MPPFLRRFPLLGLVLAAGALSTVAPAQAVTLGAFSSSLQLTARTCNLSGPSGLECLNPVISTKGTYASSGTTGAFTDATIALTTAPRIVGTSTASIGSGVTPAGGRSHYSRTDGSLSYLFSVSGPVGQTVSIRMKAAAELETSGGLSNLSFARAWARLSVGNTRPSGYSFDQTLQSAVGASTTETSDSDSFAIDQRFDFIAGDVYVVSMFFWTETQAVVSPSSYTTFGNYRAEAMVDPYFELDPADVAKGFALNFSSGINNVLTGEEPEEPGPSPVPLPAGALLLGGALMALGVARRRMN